MPILGIMASQISGHLWAPEGAYDSLATVTVPSGGVASVTFAGIPTGYRHLQVRWIDRYASTGSYTWLRFNGDSGNNYSGHVLYGNGSSAGANSGYGASSSKIYLESGAQSTSTSNSFSSGIMDILDYANTSKYKTSRILAGGDYNGSGGMTLVSGLYMSTSAISSISFTIDDGTNFAQYSQFALYGIR